MIKNKDITKKKSRDIVSIEILTEDKGVLENIASNNGLEIHEIIGLLMDGFLDCLVKANDWECDYTLEGGSLWKRRKRGNDTEKLKPCINYEDGCEEWAGCPCVYYKAESEL